MSIRLTPTQYRTLSIIARYPNGQTILTAGIWCDRHHQTLLKRGLLRLRADPFKTKASMLHGSITLRGRLAVHQTPIRIRKAAEADAERDYQKYIRDIEEGRVDV